MKLKFLYERYSQPYAMAVLSLYCALAFVCALTGLVFPALLLLFPTLFINALLLCLWRNRKNLPFILAVCAAVLCLIVPVLHKNVSFRHFLSEYVSWLSGPASAVSENTAKLYTILTAFFLMLILSVPAAAIQKNRIARYALAAAILIGMLLCAVFRFPIPQPGAAAGCVYILLTSIEVLQSASIPKRALMAGLLPAAAPVLLLLILLPAPAAPYGFPLLTRIWNQAVETANDISARISLLKSGKGLDFSVSFTGYSEESDLGGNLTSDPSPALSVSLSTPPNSSLYLAGNRKDTYTGSGWTDSGSRFTYNTAVPDAPALSDSEYEWDTLEILYMLWRAGGPDEAEACFRAQTATVTYRDIYTKTMFLPAGAVSIKLLDSRSSFREKTGGMVFDNSEKEGTSYSVRYFEWNLGSARIEAAIAASSGRRYSAENNDAAGFRRYLEETYSPLLALIRSSRLSLDEFLALRAEHIEERYLSLPGTLPERVISLAEAVTEHCTTDYQKVRALEAFLTSYPYTLTPGTPPKGGDFVDYFLFGGRAGYCTYYSSALAVMARACGIPSRYVQGYCLAATDGQTVYEVPESAAHAWTECYLEGIGWLPFEPSSGYTAVRYTPWELPEAAPDPEPGSEPAAVPEELPPEEQYPEFFDSLPPEPEPEDDTGVRKVYFFSVLIPVLAALLIFSAYAAYFILGPLIYRKRMRRESPSLKLYRNAFLSLNYLRALGLPIHSGETLREYEARISPLLPDIALSVPLKKTFADFERLRYGSDCANEKEAVNASRTVQLLSCCVRKRLGLLRSYLLMSRLTLDAGKLNLADKF